MYLFADDAKIYKTVKSQTDSICQKKSYENIVQWSDTWKMKLNADKCKVMTVINNSRNEIKYEYSSGVAEKPLEHVESMTDLGVVLDKCLNFKDHIYGKINKAYQMLGLIRRNFMDLDVDSFIILYKSMVRSLLEFAVQVWCPFKKGLIEDIEKVQKRATKMVKGFKSLPYTDRLKRLNLPTLKFRRIRGDMIEVFKILHGYYDENLVPTLNRNTDTRTRGNSMKLSHVRTNIDVRKYNFSVRVISIWNSLPHDVILVASINSFKNKLDNFWIKEDVVYNWESD